MTASMKTAELIQAKGYQARVIRTARAKTASIKVEEGMVSVVVPKALPIERIERILREKHQWIIDKIALHKVLTTSSEKQFVSGEAMSYLGRNYRLKVHAGSFEPVKLVQGRLVVTVPEGSARSNLVREALIGWYKRSALLKLKEKVRRYAKVMGVAPKSVNIKTFKSRWGSCNPKGDLDFNWIIVMAPNRIVDYVVVHELCHLKQLDHSPLFWKEVERIMPDYVECKEWLRENSQLLVV